MSATNTSSLRPAWKGAGSKGFQPPPTVASERAKEMTTARNAFAALDDDEDAAVAASALAGGSNHNSNARSDALRGAAAATTTATASGKPSGRSLSELAARAPAVPDTPNRSGGAGRFERLRSDSNVSDGGFQQITKAAVPELKVIRFTRERLLSMRPAALVEPPLVLQELFGNSILSTEGQDPVCWDTFDADEIWATQPRRATKSAAVATGGGGGAPGLTQQQQQQLPLMEEGNLPARQRTASGGQRNAPSRWERGVALPAPDQTKRKDANNADELWDDPIGAGAGGAAMDFSAFGAPDEPFDFDKMAEASRALERELHGGERPRANSDVSRTDSIAEEENLHLIKVNPARPLATAGTTIRSGSGDGVNVFEDFGDPAETELDDDAALPAIKSVSEDPSASSRLMEMIGVKREELPGLNLGGLTSESNVVSPWGAPSQSNAAAGIASLPLNPWGTSLLPTVQNEAKGIDMQVLSELEEQKRRAEELRRRQEEEAQRRLAQQQAEERTRQAMMQQQQPAGVQSQVEIVLLERITTILENSWGRSDLASILSTLHAEDSRVIPLLSSVDALRALMLRNPRRMSIRHDASFGAEMAILNMTNAQWQHHQQQEEALARQEEEERRRREELEAQRRQAAANAMPTIVADAPWYYSDPQGNIQGPFKAHEMRQWFEAGYFKGDLPISQQQTGPFRPLQILFPDLDHAFATSGDSAEDTAREQAEENARREAKQRARLEAQEAAEREQRERLAREEAARLERERLLKEEARRREEEEAAAAAAAAAQKAQASNGGSDSSSQQLKMLLGLSTSDESKVSQREAEQPRSEQKVKPPKSEDRKTSKPAKEAPKAAAAPAAPPAPAWGTTPSPKTSAKTLAEIQKEEARKNAILAMQQQKAGPSGSGWANVAAARGGSTAWQSGTVKPTSTAAVLTTPSVAPVPIVPGANRERQPSPGTSIARQARPIQHSSSASAASSAAEEFGAKMSPTMEKWCLDQMMKLNGTDDLTLVSFCMTLNNASEIRQYLTAYLGTTPQVNNFATEYINKRGLGAPVQEEWESAAQVKKTRKKKGGR